MGKIGGAQESSVMHFKSEVLTGATGTVTTSVRSSVANPAGRPVMITGVAFVVSTAASGACTLDVGVAADATTVSDTLLDGIDVNASTGVKSTLGTNGLRQRTWSATECVNVNCASGTITGLVGYLSITYAVLP